MESIDIDKLRTLLSSGTLDPGGPLEDLCQAWIKPRAMLDGDLQRYINEARGTDGIIGEPQISRQQVRVLIEALRTKQYNVTMTLLLNTFSGTDSSVFPVRLLGKGTKCAICDKEILYWHEWLESSRTCLGINEFKNRHFLAFGTKVITECVCIDCLVQLWATKKLLDGLDPGILNYKKRTSESLKP